VTVNSSPNPGDSPLASDRGGGHRIGILVFEADAMLRKILPLVALFAIAGCQTTPQRQIPDPPARPEILSANPLRIAADCQVNAAVDIDYSIQADGSVADLALSDAPACIREALTAWVSSYRYAPQPLPVVTGFAWMRVTGERGS
jgi:hypothetical protein